MADNNYDMMDDGSATSTSGNPSVEKETKADNKNEETEDQLSLVPKNFFKDDPKPGNREMVEVVEVYDGEVSIRCVYGDKDDKGGKEEKESASEKASEPEDSMMM